MAEEDDEIARMKRDEERADMRPGFLRRDAALNRAEAPKRSPWTSDWFIANGHLVVNVDGQMVAAIPVDRLREALDLPPPGRKPKGARNPWERD